MDCYLCVLDPVLNKISKHDFFIIAADAAPVTAELV
jgi:hypothetical protein